MDGHAARIDQADVLGLERAVERALDDLQQLPFVVGLRGAGELLQVDVERRVVVGPPRRLRRGRREVGRLPLAGRHLLLGIDELDRQPADLDPVAASQRLLGDADAVQSRAVPGAEVANAEALAVPLDLAVPPAQAIVGGVDAALGMPPDDDRLLLEGDAAKALVRSDVEIRHGGSGSEIGFRIGTDRDLRPHDAIHQPGQNTRGSGIGRRAIRVAAMIPIATLRPSTNRAAERRPEVVLDRPTIDQGSEADGTRTRNHRRDRPVL